MEPGDTRRAAELRFCKQVEKRELFYPQKETVSVLPSGKANVILKLYALYLAFSFNWECLFYLATLQDGVGGTVGSWAGTLLPHGADDGRLGLLEPRGSEG